MLEGRMFQWLKIEVGRAANGELLAVKEVDCSRAGEAAITSLEAEIEMLQLLRHPNIVAYYGVQRHSGVSVYLCACLRLRLCVCNVFVRCCRRL